MVNFKPRGKGGIGDEDGGGGGGRYILGRCSGGSINVVKNFVSIDVWKNCGFPGQVIIFGEFDLEMS